MNSIVSQKAQNPVHAHFCCLCLATESYIHSIP